MNLEVPTKPSLLPYGLVVAPARVSMGTAQSGSFSTYAHPVRNKETSHRQAYIPLTILQQRQFSKKMKCEPAIFTVPFVESMTSAKIAKLLNDCWYDLIRTERRLLLNPDYDKIQRQARR